MPNIAKLGERKKTISKCSYKLIGYNAWCMHQTLYIVHCVECWITISKMYGRELNNTNRKQLDRTEHSNQFDCFVAHLFRFPYGENWEWYCKTSPKHKFKTICDKAEEIKREAEIGTEDEL